MPPGPPYKRPSTTGHRGPRMVTAIQANRKYFAEFDDRQIMCQAFAHRWPIPRLHRKITIKGWRATRNEHDGSYQIAEICGTCSTERIRTTLPGGYYFDGNAHYEYVYPQFWRHIPMADEMGKRDIKNEYYARLMEDAA